MRLISESTLSEYARQFWRRQRAKRDPNDEQALAAIDAGADPVAWLRRMYDYKLPRRQDDVVCIMLVESSEEVENLLVHRDMPQDRWMRDRNLVPQPYTRTLGQLAATCLDRGYFSTPRSDRPYRYFCEWHAIGSLENVISHQGRPLIEAVGNQEYEIVDGWGRLLPFVALLKRRLPFQQFETFLASRERPRSDNDIEYHGGGELPSAGAPGSRSP